MRDTKKKERRLPGREPAPGAPGCDKAAIKKAWHIYRDPETADVTRRVMLIALDQLIEKL